MESIHPVYLDGPLKGQDFAVPAGCRSVEAVDPETELADQSWPRHVMYQLRKFSLRSGGTGVLLWLAVSEPGEPDAEVLADLLLSDAAKAALIRE